MGALTGQRAKKGLFITTSDFSLEAKDYVSRIDAKVVLIESKSDSIALSMDYVGGEGIVFFCMSIGGLD